MPADELHPNGHVVGESAGQCQRWDACRICGDDINIGEIHFERVVCFLAEFERSSRTGWSEENVNGGKSSFKVTADERADFLRLEIIRVIISSRQGIRSKHNPAFDLIAESLMTSLQVNVDHTLCIF